MILQSSDGNSFEFQILGYQFPDKTNEFYDANWLNVQINVHSSIANWKTVDACMLTYELIYLIDWFEEIVKRNYPDSPCDFMEPNLVFDCIGSECGPAIRVYFRLECCPKNYPSADPCSDELFLDFPLSDLDIPVILADLREQAKAFPRRGSLRDA